MLTFLALSSTPSCWHQATEAYAIGQRQSHYLPRDLKWFRCTLPITGALLP